MVVVIETMIEQVQVVLSFDSKFAFSNENYDWFTDMFELYTLVVKEI